MTSGIQSKGVDLDSIFAPYVAGTTKARASGISSAGSDLSNRYANIIYGTAAAATGIASESDDLNTLYAKIGTPDYKLSWDGSTFVGGGTGTTGQTVVGDVKIQFTNSTTYTITTSGTNSTTNTRTFTVPAGCTQFRISDSLVSSQGAGATVNNQATTWVNLTSINPSTVYYGLHAQISTNAGTNGAVYNMTMEFGTGGSSIYSGTATTHASADISV